MPIFQNGQGQCDDIFTGVFTLAVGKETISVAIGDDYPEVPNTEVKK